MSVEHGRPLETDTWHSDHYSRQFVGSFAGPIWDVLTDHPEGVSIPVVVGLLVDDPRMRMRQSWLLSFGAEQRYRAQSDKYERYRAMDPDSTGRDDRTWSVEDRYVYALTERVHWMLTRSMVLHGRAVVAVETEKTLYPEVDSTYNVIVGKSKMHRGGLALYKAGKPPTFYDPALPICPCGKSHHTGDTWPRPWEYHQGLGLDPYIVKQNWVNDTKSALAKKSVHGSRELLERALQIVDRRL